MRERKGNEGLHGLIVLVLGLVIIGVVIAGIYDIRSDQAVLEACLEHHTPKECACLVQPCTGSYEVGR